MQIPFEVDGCDVIFHWHSTLNRAELEVGDQMIKLNTWWLPTQQFTLKRERRWSCELDGHQVEVVKEKPGVIGIGRANTITVRVDGEFVGRETGT